jgi:hypothetical protein
MQDIFDDEHDEDIYDFKRVGSFGRFSTINNFPIEFFLTTLKSSQLDCLTYARDIKPASVDFEQLLQRDIDEERVKSEIEPYLTSPGLTDVEKRAKTIFFPPLLVAAIPVENKTMQEHYSDQEIDKTEAKFLNRVWDEYFKLKLKRTKNGYSIQPSMMGDERFSIVKEPAIFEANLTKGIEKGIKLVVIDGQHRLKALRDVYDQNNLDLSELALPICILFSPNSTAEVADKFGTETFNIPSIPLIFRQLFVDVNKNAVQVGGHFNILLSEGNMGSSICRSFCKKVLEGERLELLAQIEWNQKNKKLSNEITKKYYITSIGVIEKALTETFSKSKTIFNYLINFDTVESRVHPSGVDDYHEFPKVSWERFSFSQKRVIEPLLGETIVDLLYRLFFESNLFKPANDCFLSILDDLKKQAANVPTGNTQYQPVLDRILEYIPISDEKVMRVSHANLRKFEDDVATCKEDKVFEWLGYAIFQRAIFLTLSEILKACKISQIDSNIASDIFISFINAITPSLDSLINPKRNYCQSFIFNSNKIIPTGDVRKGIAFLMLSKFSNIDFRKSVVRECNSLNAESRFKKDLLEELENLGYRSLNLYFDLYLKSKTKDFKATYATDRSIDADEREELSQQEVIRKRDEKAFKDGDIARNEISTKFEVLVSKYVEIETNKSRKELQDILESELDVFGLTGFFADEYLDIED